MKTWKPKGIPRRDDAERDAGRSGCAAGGATQDPRTEYRPGMREQTAHIELADWQSVCCCAKRLVQSESFTYSLWHCSQKYTLPPMYDALRMGVAQAGQGVSTVFLLRIVT